MYSFFKKQYGSPRSVGMRIRNIKDELEREFIVGIRKASHNVTVYSFRPLNEEHSNLKKKVIKIEEQHEKEKNTKNST